jgi:hypothetical protein
MRANDASRQHPANISPTSPSHACSPSIQKRCSIISTCLGGRTRSMTSVASSLGPPGSTGNRRNTSFGRTVPKIRYPVPGTNLSTPSIIINTYPWSVFLHRPRIQPPPHRRSRSITAPAPLYQRSLTPLPSHYPYIRT